MTDPPNAMAEHPPVLEWGQRATPIEGYHLCKHCKGGGWYFDRHFQAGGSPGVCGWCRCTGLVADKAQR